MSETIYSKKFINSHISFKKTSFSHEDKEKDIKDFKDEQKTKESWKILSNFKTSKNFRKSNCIRNIKNPNNLLTPINKESPNKNASGYIPGERNFFNFKFNKAPTLKQNQIEINKIIKSKRSKRMKELNNIYNIILINESRTFRNNLYVTGNGFFSQKKTKIRRNKSCDEFALQKYNSYKSINEINTSNENPIFNKTGFNLHTSKNFFEENKSCKKYIVFNEFSKSKNSDKSNILPSLSTNKLKNVISPINSVTKMRMQVNDVIFNDLKKIKEFAEIEKRMMKFNLIQNIQSKKIENINNKKDSNTDYKLNTLNNLKNIFDDKYAKYSFKINHYLYYLKDILYEAQNELHFLDKEIFNYNIDIEKLILKIVRKENELEYLLEIRNFLLQVKDKYEHNEKHPTYYFELLIKDSKKLIIGNYFLNLKIINQITNKTVTAFMGSILDLRQKIEDNEIYLEDFDYNLNYFTREKIKPIFESPEEFMKLYNILMEKNLNYLQQFEYIKKIINRLKMEYDEVCITDNNDKSLDGEIIEKEEIREKLIQRNELLKQRFIRYNEDILKIRKQKEINPPKKKKDLPTYMDIEIDLDLIYQENYNKKLKSLKYNGLLLFEKIISVVKKFFNVKYVKNDFFENFKKEKLKLLELNSSIFNDDNIQLIDGYILKVISIYEDICKYVLSNHNKYMSDKNNVEFIYKIQEQINNDKRLKKSKEQRKMKFIKKDEEKKKIIEKCYKPIYYLENKMNTDTKIKRSKIMKIKGEQKLEDDEKNFAENEFNNLTKYNDEDCL